MGANDVQRCIKYLHLSLYPKCESRQVMFCDQQQHKFFLPHYHVKFSCQQAGLSAKCVPEHFNLSGPICFEEKHY